MRFFRRKKVAIIYFQDEELESGGVIYRYQPVVWETDLDYEDIYKHMPNLCQDFGDGRIVRGWDIT